MTDQAAPASGVRDRLDPGILLPVCLTLFMAGLWGQAFAPLIPEIAADLGVSVALIGQVSTVSLATIGLGSIVTGPLADHFGHRRTIATGLGGGVIAALLFAAAPNYLALLGAGFVGGIAFSMVHGVSFGTIVASFTGDVQRRALGITQAVVTSAGIIGAPVVTFIASFSDWRTTFVVMAGVLVAALLAVIRLLPEGRVSTGQRLSIRQMVASYPPVLRDSATRRIYLAAVLRAIGFGGPMIFISAFLIDQHGFTLREAGLALMATGVGIFLGNLSGGGAWLSRFDLRHAYALSTSSLGFGWLAVLTLDIPGLVAVAGIVAIFFIAGISYISRLALLGQTSKGSSATTMGLNTATLGLGNALGTAIAGLLLALGGYTLLALALPVFSTASALAIWHPSRNPS
ncbi:MAG: MFS transporter [Thermomicrobiales bacterium]